VIFSISTWNTCTWGARWSCLSGDPIRKRSLRSPPPSAVRHSGPFRGKERKWLSWSVSPSLGELCSKSPSSAPEARVHEDGNEKTVFLWTLFQFSGSPLADASSSFHLLLVHSCLVTAGFLDELNHWLNPRLLYVLWGYLLARLVTSYLLFLDT